MRAVAGSRQQMQIMYGIGGERRLPEWEATWLPSSKRQVRCGSEMPLLRSSSSTCLARWPMRCSRRAFKVCRPARSRAIGAVLLEYLEDNWGQPDEGIWEVPGPRQHFTHSKVMAWVAFDRAVKAVQQLGVDGPVERSIALRDHSHDEICRKAFDPARTALSRPTDRRRWTRACC